MALGSNCAPLTRSCRWATAAALACTTRAFTPQAGILRNSIFHHEKILWDNQKGSHRGAAERALAFGGLAAV